MTMALTILGIISGIVALVAKLWKSSDQQVSDAIDSSKITVDKEIEDWVRNGTPPSPK